MGTSFEERSSASSEGSSSNLNPCWGDVCVKRMLRAAWVDMVVGVLLPLAFRSSACRFG
jgi:hypothetical protein